MKPETMWFITGRCGLYYGGTHTRSDAVSKHCKQLDRTWHECRSVGDRAIKCTVTPLKLRSIREGSGKTAWQ